MDLAPEFRFFALALRRPQTARDLDEMRRLAAEVKDWNGVVRGARRHRVAGLVLEGMRACDSPRVPAGALARLRRQSMAGTRRSLAQVAEVARLARLLREAGIRAIVLKGVALSVQLYGEPGRRDARDIDLLVDPDELAAAQTVLLRAGYRPGRQFASARRAAEHRRWIKEYEFFHEDTGGLVELHYRLTDNPNLLPTAFCELWKDREVLRLGDGAVVATMSRRQLPLYLCVHGGDHGWGRLRWLVDFSAALQQPQNAADVLAAADATGLRWPFLHALSLAHRWLGLTVDEHLLAVCRDRAEIRRRDWLIRRSYAPTTWYEVAPRGSLRRAIHYSLWERLYRFSLKSDWRYRKSQLQREWFSPADRDVVPLPDRLSWLYPLVRPWGWLIRRLSAL